MKQRIKKQFWFSPQEAKELKRKAKLCGITETAVIRILLRGYEPREKPDAIFYDTMRELSAIGNNINQLAAKANALGFIDTPMLKTKRFDGTSCRRRLNGNICALKKQSEMAIRRRTT